jgi:hypothetical protein
MNLLIHQANGKPKLAVLTNRKQGYYDQIHADNIVKRLGINLYRKKYKIFFFFWGLEQYLGLDLLSQLSSNPSHPIHPVPL